MKNFFTTLFLFSGTVVFAQPCTPDASIQSSGFYPSPLPPGTPEVVYSETVHFRIPKDTVAKYNGSDVQVTVDSLRVTAVNGLPAGLNYQCSTATCLVLPEVTNCALISGTPAAGSDGHYPLTIETIIYGRAFGSFPVSQAQSFTSVSIDVGNVGIKVHYSPEMEAYPNPAGNRFTISTYGKSFDKISVMDMQGKEVLCEKNIGETAVEINTTALNEGVYVVLLQNEKEAYSLKLIKAHNKN